MLRMTRLAELISRLEQQIKRESEGAPSHTFEYDLPGIDDGDYGDPTMLDRRPDFVKADDEQWRQHYARTRGR